VLAAGRGHELEAARRFTAPRSPPFLKVLPSDFAIFKDLGKEAAPNGFAAVNRNDRASSVRMP